MQPRKKWDVEVEDDFQMDMAVLGSTISSGLKLRWEAADCGSESLNILYPYYIIIVQLHHIYGLHMGCIPCFSQKMPITFSTSKSTWTPGNLNRVFDVFRPEEGVGTSLFVPLSLGLSIGKDRLLVNHLILPRFKFKAICATFLIKMQWKLGNYFHR